jgi:hypothetical protein
MNPGKSHSILLYLLLACGLFNTPLAAQAPVDSSSYHPDIFLYLQTPTAEGNHITIRQSTSIKEQFNYYVTRNNYKKMQGFRVRIFFDNGQTARQRSSEVEANFKSQYPHVSVYRIYQNLYFKVTVGDFRTKSEALRFLHHIELQYPGAFIIKESINYPPL